MLIGITIWIILIATPLSIGASGFLWRLYDEDRDSSSDPGRIRLSLVLAATVTASTVAGVLLAIPTVLYLIGRRDVNLGSLVLVAIDILLVAPLLVAGYLRYRRGP